ncbi:MAG: molybdopterin molybdotransferase MoeA [Novosphingobium sp.]
MSTRAPLSLEEAQARLLSLAAPLPVETLPVRDCLGRHLADPLIARRTQPACNLSAMDGYAIRSGAFGGPWTVIGESAAGHPFEGSLGPEQAIRIATGAVAPAQADSIVLQEDVARTGNLITLTGTPPPPPGRHIRKAGSDFATGGFLLDTGAPVGPAQIGLAIAAGHMDLPVRRRARLVIVDSGDELATDATACALHQIPASNGAVLASLTAPLADSRTIGPIPDDVAALRNALDAASEADVIVTSGGASVGDHDVIRPALEAWGADLEFWRVAIKPGKPILVARRGSQIVIGLPGNPVSSYVTAFLFLLPLLRHLSGAGDVLPRTIKATLGAPLMPIGKRREFLRAHWNGETVTPLSVQDSGALSALSASNALIDRAAGAPALEAGEEVRIYSLHNGGMI